MLLTIISLRNATGSSVVSVVNQHSTSVGDFYIIDLALCHIPPNTVDSSSATSGGGSLLQGLVLILGEEVHAVVESHFDSHLA